MKYLVTLIMLFTIVGCSSKIEYNQIQRIDGSSITRAALDTRIKSLVDTADVTGFTVTIFNHDTVAYQKAFGYIVALLAYEGLIDLDKPIQDYLNIPIPEMHFKREWRGFQNIANDDRYKVLTALGLGDSYTPWYWENYIPYDRK